MSKPIPQTGVTDGPDEPSSPPHDRGHERPQHVAVDAAILHQGGCEIQSIFWQVARAARPGRRSGVSGPPGLHGHFVVRPQPGRLRVAFLLWRHAGRGRDSRAYSPRPRTSQTAGRAERRGGHAVFGIRIRPEVPGGADHRLCGRAQGLRSGGAEVGGHRQPAGRDPGSTGQGRQGPQCDAVAAIARDSARLLEAGATEDLSLSWTR